MTRSDDIIYFILSITLHFILNLLHYWTGAVYSKEEVD